MVQNHTKGPFDPKYVGDYCVVAIKGNQVEVKPAIGGPTEMKHIKHVKYIHPVDQYIKHVPDYSTFGRKTTLRINPKKYPRLTLAVGRFLTHNQYRTNNPSSIYTQCGREHLKHHWKKEIYSKGINLHVDTSVINGNTSAITSIDVNNITK